MAGNFVAHDVFISYAKPDEAAALALASGLEAHGLKCWVLGRDEQGLEFAEATLNALRGTRAVVFLLSARSQASPFVAKELDRAARLEKPIYVYRMDGSAPGEPLRQLIETAQHFMETLPPSEGLRLLAEKLREIIPRVTERSAEQNQSAIAGRRSRTPLIIGAAITILIIPVAAYLTVSGQRGKARPASVEIKHAQSKLLHPVQAPVHEPETTQTQTAATATPQASRTPEIALTATPHPTGTPAAENSEEQNPPGIVVMPVPEQSQLNENDNESEDNSQNGATNENNNNENGNNEPATPQGQQPNGQ